MRFSLIDRITELRDGESVTAIKVLTLSEEYLADHFPLFPVMPGVMMLESMYQACAWLIRKTDNFPTRGCFRETRNVKFSSFVEPGQVLTVRGQLQSRDDRLATFKAEASVEGRGGGQCAADSLERYNAADQWPARTASDAMSRRHFREYFDILYRPETVASKS